jgi:hypothetical protein
MGAEGQCPCQWSRGGGAADQRPRRHPDNYRVDRPAGLQSAAGYAAQLASITDPSKALSVVQQVSGALSAALVAVQPFYALLPPPVAVALEAAEVLLPVVMALIPGAPAAPASAARSSMSPAQAELILQGIAAK